MFDIDIFLAVNSVFPECFADPKLAEKIIASVQNGEAAISDYATKEGQEEAIRKFS